MGLAVSALSRIVPGIGEGLADKIHNAGISYIDVNNLDEVAKVEGVGVATIAAISMQMNFITNHEKYYAGYGSTEATGFFYRFDKPKGEVFTFNKPIEGGSINRVYHQKESIIWWLKGYVDGANLNRQLMCDGKTIRALDNKKVTGLGADIVRALYKEVK